MDAKRLILTRQLPKTGQITSYYEKDDGNYEAGWWRGRLNADNKPRFIAKSIWDDDVVIDRATGLMWAADGQAEGCISGNSYGWAASIAAAMALSFFASFSDWRMPNIKELVSIVDYEETTPAIDGLFTNTYSTYYWSSTTRKAITAEAFVVHFASGSVADINKGSTAKLRCVRGGL